MTTVNINFTRDGGAITGWNNTSTPTTTGQKIADLLDSSGSSTGLSLWVTTAFSQSLSSSTLATAAAHGVPEQVWEQLWYSNTTSAVEIRGFGASQTGTIKAAGDGGNGARDADYFVNGGTANRYNANGGEPFTAPVEIAFTANGAGVVEFSGAVVSVFWYLNWLTVEYTEAATLSIDSADNVTTESQTATFTLSGNTAAPTSATLNGTDVGTITDLGAGVYRYTAPLIADDATADLVVSVDATTVSTVISYANSYPYDQVTHGVPNANSINVGNQYATSLPYEWKVVTDANAGVVTIDWAAMASADGLNDDIDTYATTVADGSTTVTIGVFIPESGATETFSRTITIADGQPGLRLGRSLKRSIKVQSLKESLRKAL